MSSSEVEKFLEQEFSENSQFSETEDLSSELGSYLEGDRVKVFDLFSIGFLNLKNKYEFCLICRNKLLEHCIACVTSNDNVEKLSCSIICGKCNHMFHQHCISRWLITRNVCPVDNGTWVVKHII